MTTAESKPHNGQQEPRYTDEPTVVCSIRYPNLTCHYPSTRCSIQEPHEIAGCGEFAVPAPSTEGEPDAV